MNQTNTGCSFRVHIAPIEPFAERYSNDWLYWFPKEMASRGWEVNNILPHNWQPRERRGGAWLDPIDTWAWKGAQVARLADMWRSGTIRHNDWILVTDAWGPLLTAAAYMRDLTGVKVNLAGFWHAGVFDPHDMLSRTGVAAWGRDYEAAAVGASDLAFMGSMYCGHLMDDACLPDLLAKARITGYPIHQARIMDEGLLTESEVWGTRRPMRVVFPHRLDAEKRPQDFAEVRSLFNQLYPDMAISVEWLRTRDGYVNKATYYRQLAESRVAFSSATQETFGIAMQEAAALGCRLVAPARCSYPEVVRPGSGTLYTSLHQAAEQIHAALLSPEGPAIWDGYHEHAIARLAGHMENYH